MFVWLNILGIFGKFQEEHILMSGLEYAKF